MVEETTVETLSATTTNLPDTATVVSRQQDLLDDERTKEKVDEVQNATRREEEEDLQAEPSQIREVIVDPPEVASSSNHAMHCLLLVFCQQTLVQTFLNCR